MDASERTRRRILRGCKYRPIAKLLQHDRAKNFITKFLASESPLGKAEIIKESDRLRNLLSDTPFERETLDLNADFLSAFAKVYSLDHLPKAEITKAPRKLLIHLSGVAVNPDIRLGFQRTTKTNKLRTGFMTIRYAKGKPLSKEVGRWQSSLLFGCRRIADESDSSIAERKLCLTLDALTGQFIPAPGNAVSRFNNMKAACSSIADMWDNIEPPSGAIIAGKSAS